MQCNCSRCGLRIGKYKNQSVHTLEAYFRDVANFIDFCYDKQMELKQVEATDLREYVAYRVEKDQLSTSSLQRHLTFNSSSL